MTNGESAVGKLSSEELENTAKNLFNQNQKRQQTE